MDKVTLAYLDMFNVLEHLCNDSQAKWGGSQPFTDAYADFLAKKQVFVDLCYAGKEDGTSETSVKQTHRSELMQLGGILSIGLSAYAARIGDDDLRALVYFSPTDFKKASQLALVGLVEKLKEKAEANLAALAPYGITQQTVDKASALIADFNKADEAQKRAKKGFKKNNAAIKQALIEARNVLTEQLDLCAALVIYEHPEFEYFYWHGRKITIHGRRHLALLLKIVDAVTGAPVPNAVVEIHPEKIKRKASKLGNLRIRNLRDGKQLIIITADGYETLTLEREFSTEHKLREEARMRKGD